MIRGRTAKASALTFSVVTFTGAVQLCALVLLIPLLRGKKRDS
ncbi:MAG: hypothetical protein ABJB98_11965 [Actinomycetota bacterium]